MGRRSASLMGSRALAREAARRRCRRRSRWSLHRGQMASTRASKLTPPHLPHGPGGPLTEANVAEAPVRSTDRRCRGTRRYSGRCSPETRRPRRLFDAVPSTAASGSPVNEASPYFSIRTHPSTRNALAQGLYGGRVSGRSSSLITLMGTNATHAAARAASAASCSIIDKMRPAADPDTHFRPESVPGVRVKRMSAGVLDSRLQPGLS